MIGCVSKISKSVKVVTNPESKDFTYNKIIVWSKDESKYLTLLLTDNDMDRAIKRAEQKEQGKLLSMLYRSFLFVSKIFSKN